jgi:hypothetical protein
MLFLGIATSCSSDSNVDTVGRISTSVQELSAAGSGEDVVLDVFSNAYWRIEFTDADTGSTVRWITCSVSQGQGDSKVVLSVGRNRTGAIRRANIHLITEAENDEVNVLLTQDLPDNTDVEGYTFPIFETFEIAGDLSFANGYISGNDIIFDDGMVISRTGEAADLTYSCPCHLSYNYQAGVAASNWADGDAWIATIPVKESLSGDLRILLATRRDGLSASSWDFYWSSDAQNWNSFESPLQLNTTAADAVFKAIDFTIPADKAIPAGGKLYLKWSPKQVSSIGNSTAPSALFQTGIYIVGQSCEKSTLPAVDTDKVVFANGFDDLNEDPSAPVEMPEGFFRAGFRGNTYTVPGEQKNIVSVLRAYKRPGCLQLSNASSSAKGTYAVKLSRLTDMNIAKTDLKVSFRAAGYMGATGTIAGSDIRLLVDETSGAKVDNEGKAGETEPNVFKQYTLYVRDATPETTITISNENSAADLRYFLDDVLVEVEGEPTRPDVNAPTESSIKDLRSKRASSAIVINDNIFIRGRVVSTDNLPSNYLALSDDTAGIFVQAEGSGLKVGDVAEVVVLGATLKTNEDGLLTLIPTDKNQISKTSASSENPTAKSITVDELKSGAYEAMYVVLPESQVISADLKKTMLGELTFELADGTTYKVKTYASASFASATAPQGKGVVRGVAGTSMLMPTSSNDLASMTGTRIGQSVYAITPISGMIRMMGSGMDVFRVTTYDDNTRTMSYTNGCSIQKLGNSDVAGCAMTHTTNVYDGRFLTTGWGGDKWEENALLFKIKATSQLKGNLRFGFGLFAASTQLVPKNYKVEWSNDNATWYSDVRIRTMPFTDDKETSNNEFALTTSANSSGYKMAIFNIPDNEAIAEGGYLYIRIRQADNTTCHKSGGTIATSGQLIFQHTFYLTTHEKKAYHTTDLPKGDNVLLTYGFDECFYGHDYFIPTWQCAANAPNVYTAATDWELSGNVYELPGYIRLGSSASASASITTPALTALSSTPTDITLTFKLGIHLGGTTAYTPDSKELDVTVTAGSVASIESDLSSLPDAMTPTTEAEAQKMESAYHNWHDVTVKISGATSDTRVTIGGKGRHYIDDIVITKN